MNKNIPLGIIAINRGLSVSDIPGTEDVAMEITAGNVDFLYSKNRSDRGFRWDTGHSKIGQYFQNTAIFSFPAANQMLRQKCFLAGQL